MLIKPFTAPVNTQGQAIVSIQHNIHGLIWKVYQIGFALGKLAPSPQVAAHVNGVPLASTVPLQPSVFSAISQQSPYAMESFFVGPPYIILSAGDSIMCGLIAGLSGDVFTAAAYVEERPASMLGSDAITMGN